MVVGVVVQGGIKEATAAGAEDTGEGTADREGRRATARPDIRRSRARPHTRPEDHRNRLVEDRTPPADLNQYRSSDF